ncbi:ankyrin repeat-containing domain protein [Aspergillus heterothallicus]
MEAHITQMEDKLKSQADSIQASQRMQMGALLSSSAASQGIGVRVAQYTSKCRAGCQCACHQQRKASAIKPRYLSSASSIGSPLGFCWSKIVQLQLSYRPNIGLQFNLSTLSSVSDTAPCVEYALHGDIEGLKSLFQRGRASPLYVSVTRGYTLVRWALYGKQYETVRFLMQQGGDADYRPISTYDNSPRNKASDIQLNQSFSDLHKIVCGLSLKDLDEALLSSPQSMDVTDALGRTPLLWAAVRGDATEVAILLAHGANPNILDAQLAPPISYAADRRHATCVRLLLEAGAETVPILPNGYIGGSALNCAARNASDPLVLKNLLDFGADIEAAGVDGRTSLIHVARTDNVSPTVLLLEYGANINATSASNQTPLITAIINNSHRVLKLLLDRWMEYSECPRLKEPNLLEVAALYGDQQTLRILAGADHFRLKCDHVWGIGNFMERLKERHDVSEKLVLAFAELLAVIETEILLDEQDEQDALEKGLWS